MWSFDTVWSENGITIAGGLGCGNRLNQLAYPWSLCVNEEEEEADEQQMIYVSEYSNQRVTGWRRDAMSGIVVAGGKQQGYRTDQLNGPANVILDRRNDCLIIAEQGNRRIMRWSRQNTRPIGEVIISDIDCWGLAFNRQGDLYTSDYKKHEIKRWQIGERINGIVVAGGHDKGDQLNQLFAPALIFIDQDDSLYISDVGNHRVIKWMDGSIEGIVVAGGHGQGDQLNQLSYPSGLVVDQRGTIYVVDSTHHRVMRWLKDSNEGGIIIGKHGQGKENNQLHGPVGLTFDRFGHLYVADNLNHRIQKFIRQ